jgi:hypothetical protein
MIEMIEQIVSLVGMADDIIGKAIGFRPIDTLVVIVLVQLVSKLFKLKQRFESHTWLLTALCFAISVLYSLTFISDTMSVKEAFVFGFRLAAVSTLVYNLMKPLVKPLLNRFYDWLESKGVKVRENEHE